MGGVSFWCLLVWCFTLVCGDCIWNEEVESPTIDCDLRILDFRRNSSDIPGVKRVRYLNIECSDVFFFESQLRSDHFGDLPHLTELNIRFCKIRQLPPRSFVSLSRLKRLSINTFNADWTSLVLEPDYESLIGLDLLESFDLSDNNIQKLPPGLFCPLTNVKKVNLSRNALQDLEQLGLSDRTDSKCQLPIQELIISFNDIRAAPPGSLAFLKKLRNLDLSHNSIGVLLEDTFVELRHLEKLDISHNRLVSLPPGLFSTNVKLKELQLANNSIGTIDLYAFENLTDLQVLNLSGNSLDENWIKPGIFDGLRNLILLDLSSNHISKVDAKLFVELASLQVLSLDHNQIHTIASNSFASQINLHILLLSHNQLESLHHQTLTGLAVLSSISLDHNKLHSLHPVALKNCTSLEEISLSNNYLTQVPKALHQLPSLKTLDLSSNVIGVLKRESLQGLPKLSAFKIGRNELSRIGEGAFKEAPNLEHLDLGGNRFQKLEQETFKTLKHLQSLNLAENQLEDINGLLQSQITLKWLNISNNRLAWFDYAFVPPSVEWLDVQANQIDDLGNYYNLYDNYALKYLDARKNRISEIGQMSILPNMEHVFLTENSISKIGDNTFLGKYNLQQVHLERNQLRTLSKASMLISPYKNIPMFYLSRNPFLCNCELQWLKHINTKISEYPQVMDMDRVHCSVVNHTNSVLRRHLTQVKDEDFLCEYEKHCLDQCMCCDFFACDCQMKCPKGCTCFHDHDWSSNVIQCSAGGFSVLPKVIPMDTTVLYLDKNNLTTLKAGLLVGRTKLKKLSIKSSQVAKIENQTFAGLQTLQTLDLSRNQLKHLYGYEFRGLNVLRELHLDNNQLVSIDSNTFKPLKYLSALKLDGNLLISFPIWMLSSNANLNYLTLANNWWQCDCDFVRKFRMFIDGNVDIIPDAKQITCTSSETSLSQLNECSGIMTGSGYHFRRTFAENPVPLAVGITVSCLCLMAATVTVFKLRETFLVWLHAKYGVRICRATPKKEEGKEQLFDALVLYSLKDEKFVMDDLVKKLEPSYRLCLNHRDLSGIYTSEAFKSAVTASMRHVIILSEGFFATEWDYVKDLDLSNVIIIFTTDISKNDEIITKDASEFIKSSRKRIKYNSGKFWRLLRYYLPDPTKIDTKEGGAELDVSGVWTFTSMDGINDTGVSTTKLLTSPSNSPRILSNMNAGGSSSSTPMLSMLQQSNFPAPPVRKQPHQCSTHYLAGAPSSPLYASHNQHQRSVSNQLIELSNSPATRSCGTNVVHQRSASAIVSKAQSFKQLRASASNIIQDKAPTPPPKVKTRNSFYNLPQSGVTLPENIYDNSTPFLQQLVCSSPNPELYGRLPPIGQADPQPVVRRATAAAHHQRSTSLLDPTATKSPEQGRSQYVKHGRSSSTLAPMAATPRHIRSSAAVTRTASMHQPGNHFRSAVNLQQARLGDDQRLRVQYKSTSNIVPNPVGNGEGPRHARSSSTPYEGFVL